VKVLTTLLLATLAALAVYSARRRIMFALKTGAVVYIVLLFARLLLSAWSLGDRWEDLVWPVFFMLVGWAILWWVSTTYAERRSRTIRGASEAGRRGRRSR
jgi:asparagine N-glycosylation enzyme membrane subunit Stt3